MNEINEPAKEGLESLESAAQRLLAKLEQRGRKVAGRLKAPDKIQSSTDAPRIEKKAAEMAARVSASLSGQVARLGGLRRVRKADNDNGAGGVILFPAWDEAMSARPQYHHGFVQSVFTRPCGTAWWGELDY